MISDVGDALDAIIDLARDKEQAMTNATTQSDIDAETQMIAVRNFFLTRVVPQ
jgi:hypothetical protein